MTYKTFHVYGTRPTETPKGQIIPDGWLIFNAPRPLAATEIVKEIEGRPGKFLYEYVEWQGQFLHGIFYTAVDPSDEKAIERNNALDGWVIEYHGDAEIIAYGREMCEQYGIDFEDFDLDDFRVSFFNDKNGK